MSSRSFMAGISSSAQARGVQGSSEGPLLVFFHRLIMLSKRRRKMMCTVISGDEKQRPRIRRIQGRANGLQAWIGNGARRQPGETVRIVRARAQEIFLVNVAVIIRQAVNHR